MSRISDDSKEFKLEKEDSLRSHVIRLAYEYDSLRSHLLPILKQARGVTVRVKELPQSIREALREVDYNRTAITVESVPSVSLRMGGGDGYRAFVVIVNMRTGQSEVTWGSWGGANMFSPRNPVDNDDKSYSIPEDGAVIKGTDGGSRPVYATLYVNPVNMPTLIAQKVDLSPGEDKALAIIAKIKPGYRQNSFDREGLGPYASSNPIIESLVAKRLVDVTGAGIKITVEGKNAVNHNIFV